MNPFEAIDLPKVINAAGKMTYLGSSAVTPEVAAVMAEAAQSYVDMAALKEAVGRKAAALSGAEAACVTASAAAGIAISVAAALTGTDLSRIEALPEVKGPRRDVILQKGHAVNFGANLTQMIRMTGASVQEIGTVNGVKPYHLEAALTEQAAAVVYVVSHHAVSNEMLSLAEVVKLASPRGVPVIVDAAAEVDLQQYWRQGASAVIYSGHKAIGGPTSGLILGTDVFMQACRLQEKGYGRAMKIGKENIMGLYAALDAYVRRSPGQEAAHYGAVIEALEAALRGIPGLRTKRAMDATRPIPRLQAIVEASSGLSARDAIRLLEAGSPSIRTRNHLADEGILQFDPRELKLEDIERIGAALRGIMSAGKRTEEEVR